MKESLTEFNQNVTGDLRLFHFFIAAMRWSQHYTGSSGIEDGYRCGATQQQEHV